jgi:hypothetical protein
VKYTAIATTRFREYFPAAITANPDNITRKSQPETLSILSSSRPAAPKVLYVIPTFAWEPEAEDAWNFSRRGGGLRIYLDRPWYSSGEGELLGAVLWQCSAPLQQKFQSFVVPEVMRNLVTQWGMDPIWNAPAPPAEAVPREEHFRNAVVFGHGLSLDELSSQLPLVPFAVAGHTVAYDNTRKLWYCDMEMDPGDAYFPFVRLALARYQPESIPDAHLSRVVLADFIQLMPDRSASITFDPIDTTSLEVAITGKTYRGPGAAMMSATLETQAPGGGDTAWVPVRVFPMQAYAWFGPATLWTAQITLPSARGSRPFRLVIEEFETFARDVTGTQTRRLVYADILGI